MIYIAIAFLAALGVLLALGLRTRAQYKKIQRMIQDLDDTKKT